MAQLRTEMAARLLLERLLTSGPMTEQSAAMLLEARAPGRSGEVLEYAHARGMTRRMPGLGDEPTLIVATHVARRPVAA